MSENSQTSKRGRGRPKKLDDSISNSIKPKPIETTETKEIKEKKKVGRPKTIEDMKVYKKDYNKNFHKENYEKNSEKIKERLHKNYLKNKEILHFFKKLTEYIEGRKDEVSLFIKENMKNI